MKNEKYLLDHLPKEIRNIFDLCLYIFQVFIKMTTIQKPIWKTYFQLGKEDFYKSNYLNILIINKFIYF